MTVAKAMVMSAQSRRKAFNDVAGERRDRRTNPMLKHVSASIPHVVMFRAYKEGRARSFRSSACVDGSPDSSADAGGHVDLACSPENDLASAYIDWDVGCLRCLTSALMRAAVPR